MDDITLDTAPKLKVDELKAAIKRRGSSFGGKDKKADLLSKLVDLLKDEAASKEAPQSETVAKADESHDLETLSKTDIPEPATTVATENVTVETEIVNVDSANVKGEIETSVIVDSETIESHAEPDQLNVQSSKITEVVIEPVSSSMILSEDTPTEDESIKATEAAAISSTNIVTDETRTENTTNSLTAGDLVSDVEKDDPISDEKRIRELALAQQANKAKMRQKTLSEVQVDEFGRTVNAAVSPAASTSTGGKNAGIETLHVRIDNFQRPLNSKNLVAWLNEKCGTALEEKDLWINGIKTHCYVDFQTIDDAQRCIAAVTGIKFSMTSPLTLVAAFTSVSVAAAPTSTEAAAKPGEWQRHPSPRSAGKVSSLSADESVGAGFTGVAKLVGFSADSAGAVPDTAASPRTAAAALRAGGGVTDVVRRAAAVAADSAKSSNILDRISPRASVQGNTLTGFSTRKHRLEQGGGETDNTDTIVRDRYDPGASGMHIEAAEDSSAKGDAVISLDQLFKKTTAAPPLYWLPVPAAESERRQAGHYSKKTITAEEAERAKARPWQGDRLPYADRGDDLRGGPPSKLARRVDDHYGGGGGRGGPGPVDRYGPASGGHYGPGPRDRFGPDPTDGIRWVRGEIPGEETFGRGGRDSGMGGPYGRNGGGRDDWGPRGPGPRGGRGDIRRDSRDRGIFGRGR